MVMFFNTGPVFANALPGSSGSNKYSVTHEVPMVRELHLKTSEIVRQVSGGRVHSLSRSVASPSPRFDPISDRPKRLICPIGKPSL